MGWCRITLTSAGKERVRRYIGKMVFLLVDVRNRAYRAKYAVIVGLYMVSGSIGIYGDSFLDYKKREKEYIKGLDRDCYILFYGSSTYVGSGSIYVDGRLAFYKG